MSAKWGIEMKCEICDGTFETISRRDEEAEIGFIRIVEYRKCNLCLSGMIIYHTPFPAHLNNEFR
jgi:hypothetical protein